ncbi:unnamed protein product [Callosobruchus maculatus]|uniref:Uncharacterized protein n=1 Tax=Callosobruchus maculatus TaxID=64391 RepID=A0A653CJK0_CALMS|nr:unnamed protein product [Callosobruchus maculatus]
MRCLYQPMKCLILQLAQAQVPLHKNRNIASLTKHLIIRDNGDTIFQLFYYHTKMIVKDHLLKRSREAQHLENQGITVFMLTYTSASDIEEHIESATVTKCDVNQDADRLVKLDQLVNTPSDYSFYQK